MDFENILIMPLFDSDGKLKGVVQLVNKIDSSEIPEEDAIELSQICPSIAEVLNFCDLATDVNNVSQGLTLTMDGITKELEATQEEFRHPTVPSVMYHLDTITRSVKSIIETKRQALFENGTLA